MPTGVYTRTVRDPLERLLERIVVDLSGCWVWQGSIAPNGYGRMGIGQRSRGTKRTVYTHRLSYELYVGPIPAGRELDHLCRNRACCNPGHLEPVTRRENTLRGDAPALLAQINGAKTHCIHGHPFDEANTTLRHGGGRRCRACSRERHRRKDHQR